MLSPASLPSGFAPAILERLMGAQEPSRPTGNTGAYEDACHVTPGELRVRRKRVYAIVEQPVQVQEGDQTKDRAREDEVGLHLLHAPVHRWPGPRQRAALEGSGTLQPHRHHDVLRVHGAGRVDQTAAV